MCNLWTERVLNSSSFFLQLYPETTKNVLV